MSSNSEPRQRPLRERIGAWVDKPLDRKIASLTCRAQDAFSFCEDFVFEKRHGVDCGGFVDHANLVTTYSASLPHAMAYEAISCLVLRELFNEAHKTGIAFDNFLDIGSGKGKACFYAAYKSNFKNIIGVEFSRPLVEVAEVNKQRFGARHINFVNTDARMFSLPKGDSLIFLFNPFGEIILTKFLENNMLHFKENRSVIAYANDQHRRCLVKFGFETVFRNQLSQDSLYRYP